MYLCKCVYWGGSAKTPAIRRHRCAPDASLWHTWQSCIWISEDSVMLLINKQRQLLAGGVRGGSREEGAGEGLDYAADERGSH